MTTVRTSEIVAGICDCFDVERYEAEQMLDSYFFAADQLSQDG